MNKLSKKEVIKEFCFAFFVNGIFIMIPILFHEWNDPRTDFGLLTIATLVASGFIICLVGILLPFIAVFFIPYGIGIIPIIIFPASIYYLYKKFPISKIKYRKYLLTLIVFIWGFYGAIAVTVTGGV